MRAAPLRVLRNMDRETFPDFLMGEHDCSISERAVEAVVVIEMGLVMPDGLPCTVMDIYNIVFKSLFGFCFWVLFLGFVFGFWFWFLRTGQ